MKIVADENIPLLEHYFGAYGEVFVKPGRLITRDDLFDADVLLVRSVTRVNELLLHNTPVKYVGTATAGFDHIDTEWLDKAGVAWGVATASNADAVAEYVVCVIAALQKQNLLTRPQLRAGVVGVGNVGKRVVEKLQALGFDVLQCDPLRVEKDFPQTDLKNFADLDFISLHTPLTYSGKYPTHHLIEKTFLQKQKNHCVLLNAGRGEVVSFTDLKQYGTHLHWCLDVWEQEPVLDKDVLKSAIIATPHIAGYSVQAKLRGVEMIYRDMRAKNILPDKNISVPEYPRKHIQAGPSWQDNVLNIFDPRVATNQLKQYPDRFDQLRKDFVERYEFAYVDFVVGKA